MINSDYVLHILSGDLDSRMLWRLQKITSELNQDTEKIHTCTLGLKEVLEYSGTSPFKRVLES